MFNFKPITDWKLKTGSHKFPGPDGGTCINEAAIVAAGFEYTAIDSAHDCPVCFSRPIAQLAICLNDMMPDDLRQELLMPFVTKLSGTVDAYDIEWKRLEAMIRLTMTELLPNTLIQMGMANVASQLTMLRSLEEITQFPYIIRHVGGFPMDYYYGAYDTHYSSYPKSYSPPSPDVEKAISLLGEAAGRWLRPTGESIRRPGMIDPLNFSGKTFMSVVERTVENDFVTIACAVGHSLAIMMRYVLGPLDSRDFARKAVMMFKQVISIGKQADAIDACTVSANFEKIKQAIDVKRAKQEKQEEEEFKKMNALPNKNFVHHYDYKPYMKKKGVTGWDDIMAVADFTV